MLVVWNTLLVLLWPLMYFYRPFRGTISQRLGGFGLANYDPQATGPRVLINAVSAGEVVAIAPLIRLLKERHPGAQVALLTTTDSGQEMARSKLGNAVDCLAYFPLIDLPFVVARYLDKFRPHAYISTESELWPNIMHQCGRRGIPVLLANARLYLHNKHGWRARLHKRLYGMVDRIICQDTGHFTNFRHFGVPDDKLSVSGNLKFDFALPPWDDTELDSWRERWGIGADVVITAGSTHPGEEELVLDALRSISFTGQLILAPRHIERADDAVALARDRGFTAATMAQVEAGATGWQVLVVDRYGVLVDMYRTATLVIMGGTFHPRVGGHNLLEATILGKPVITGPHCFSITAQLELLSRVEGVITTAAQVDGGAEPLVEAVRGLLAEPELAQDTGERARKATLSCQGAAGRVLEVLEDVLPADAGGLT